MTAVAHSPQIDELRRELLAAADELGRLAQLARGAATAEAGGNARLDRETCELVVNGRPQQLTRGLAAIVGAMVEANGRTVARPALARAVFGPHATQRQGRDVDAQVSRLRVRFPEIGRHVVTVRGVGYRWKESGTCQ